MPDQVYDSMDVAGVFTMLTLLAVCLASWAIVGYRAWRRQRRIPRMFAHPHQDAIDSLALQRWRAALARNAKAVRGEQHMRNWHQGIERPTANVVPIRRTRHVRN